jgi:glycosyltransferase involved in cell wall biosynthesis
MSIRIIHLVTSGINEKSGGPSWVVINLAKQFAKSNHAVKISSFGNFESDREDLQSLREDLFTIGVTLDCYFSNFLNKYGFGNWYTILGVLRQSPKTEPLIFNYVYSLPVFIQSVFSRRKYGLFLMPHGSFSRREFTRIQIVKYVYLLMLFQTNFHKKFHFVFATNLERANSAMKLNQNQTVIGFGIEPEPNIAVDFQLGNKLLFLGRIDKIKNLSSLLYSLKMLDLKKYDLSLEIAGDGDQDEVLFLKNIIAMINLEDFVTFTGWRSGFQKQESLMRSKILVLPSHSENFGVVVLEAAAKGIPSVLSPNVGIAENVALANAGAVAKSTSPTDISAAILEVLDNWNEYSANALRFSTENSWAKIGSEWELLFKTHV